MSDGATAGGVDRAGERGSRRSRRGARRVCVRHRGVFAEGVSARATRARVQVREPGAAGKRGGHSGRLAEKPEQEEVAGVAARVKVIDLAKELGVTSKDLIVALEGMGHKGMRAMSPLLAATANELRIKLGRGRELPPEAKPRRAPKPKEAAAEGAVELDPASAVAAEPAKDA